MTYFRDSYHFLITALKVHISDHRSFCEPIATIQPILKMNWRSWQPPDAYPQFFMKLKRLYSYRK